MTRKTSRARGAHTDGKIVAGILAPHPPHLAYAENPPQNEPRAECGWEGLRWGYARLRRALADRDYDVLIVHSPHWRTIVGHHMLGVPRFESLSVDPIFPNLFRYHFNLDVDVELAELIHDAARDAGLVTKMMRNPDFRVDYGTLTSCHMVRPDWDKPIVGLSSNAAFSYFGNDVGQEQMIALGEATRRAVARSGRRAVLLASNSLSHRHFTVEPATPEDMSHEHIYHHGQYLWDMRVLDHMRSGRSRQLVDEIPDFIDQTESESNAGCLTWLIAALGFPEYPAEVYAYGTVIGTGNAVVEWDPRLADPGFQPQPRPRRAVPGVSTSTPSANVRAAAARRDAAVAAAQRTPDTAPMRDGPASAGSGRIVAGYVVPGLPHPYLVPERAASWQSIRDGFERVRHDIESLDADMLLLYSTQWISVIGHQIQAHPEPKWTHVDPDWHDLGSMPYHLSVDPEFAACYEAAARRRGLHARTVAYHGFPIDTGTVVALGLLNPQNRLRASVVSCNMYADRAETIVLGKAAADAARRSGRRVVGVAVTALSNRMFTEPIDPHDDRISSLKDDEWNHKLLEILAQGRLEDVAQLARQFTAQANGDRKLKAIWWLAAAMGQHNNYKGHVYDYKPLLGTGAALVGLVPATEAASNLEFDEEDVEVYGGDRGVLDHGEPATPAAANEPDAAHRANEPRTAAVDVATSSAVRTADAPHPVGAYPHARRVGNLLYLSGIGPRQAGSDAIPGGPVRDGAGTPLEYDVAAQTRAVIHNVSTILEAAGSTLQHVLDVSVFLIDMERDFDAFNRVYAEFFSAIDATRTTVAVRALPTPIAVEFKVIASCGTGA